jgi:F-type H+-transporting ATPase subunit delta
MKIQRLVRQAASRALLSRTYATETATGTKKGLVVNFTLPHVTLLKNLQATQVNLSSTDGDMGILADHVPAIAQLKPGVIDILSAEGGSASSKKFFVSGGFAVMNPDSSLNINAVEAVPLEDLDLEVLS